MTRPLRNSLHCNFHLASHMQSALRIALRRQVKSLLTRSRMPHPLQRLACEAAADYAAVRGLLPQA